jgi:adenylate cyclase class 2
MAIQTESAGNLLCVPPAPDKAGAGDRRPVMLEIEMKFPITDLVRLQAQLEAMKAHLDQVQHEEDHYFNAPDRDFARTDEALRLRRVGDSHVLTYKGPKQDAQAKIRTEIEVPLASEPEAAQRLTELLKHLGYRSVALLRKERTVYRLEYGGFPVQICLDQVEGVGPYVEVEIVAPESERDYASQTIQELARRLGLSGSERRSYLELWLTADKHR